MGKLFLRQGGPGNTLRRAIQRSTRYPPGRLFRGNRMSRLECTAKAWWPFGANDTTTDDGSEPLRPDINPKLLVGVALHELTHAMGAVP